MLEPKTAFTLLCRVLSDSGILGEFEQVVLLATLRLGNDAYGVTIKDEILARTGRNPSPGALYTTLERLEEKGLLSSRIGEATAERGGRAKRYVKVTQKGLGALAKAHQTYSRLIDGLQLPGLSHA